MFLLQQFAKGGVALYPLSFCSILVVAVIFERMWAFSRLGQVPCDLVMHVESFLAAGNWQQAVRLLDGSSSPFARVMKASLMRKRASQQEISDVLTLACEAEIATASRPLLILGTIGNIAPFIGLFGTVIGIMHTFYALRNNDAGLNIVGPGISEALIATAAGLAVAIIAVVGNNWCNSWVTQYRLDMERFGTEWSYRLEEIAQTTQTASANAAITEPVV